MYLLQIYYKQNVVRPEQNVQNVLSFPIIT